ncbi:MAG: 1-acyl-sn-glycerol-3-phosphate acyltransferase [Myxococcales bacterium]|nr:1-acyl-sn-glycerol-3-phosphate acyltransferase [Myxococcales bacterium]
MSEERLPGTPEAPRPAGPPRADDTLPGTPHDTAPPSAPPETSSAPPRGGDDTVSVRASIEGPEPETTPQLGAAMHQWGWLGRVFARLFFSKIYFPTEAVDKIRDAHERGTVVYVLRVRHTLEFLYFNYAFAAYGLPLARFANGVRYLFWLPLKLLLRRIFGRDKREGIDTFRRLTRAGRSSVLFLKSNDLIPPSDFKGPYLETLIELDRQVDRPIMLVPLTLLWGRGREMVRKAPSRLKSIWGLDRLIGDRDEPRMLRRVWQVLRHARRQSLAVVCDPVDLTEFIADAGVDRDSANARGESTEAALADSLRAELAERIESERRVRIGPQRAHYIQIRRRVLERAEVVEAMREQADATGASLSSIRRKARRELKRMEARMSPRGVLRGSRLCRWLLWKRAFEGFEVDEAGIAKLQEVGKAGPLIYLPSHRSHIDYLVLGDLLTARDLVPPHVAAGANLSFWPLGWIFRTAGAFFIRRRIGGDHVYSALLKGYLRELLIEGHSLEIFIEGGRTRTGRLLAPKLGLLSVVADLVASGDAPQVHVVPVSIGYERLVELPSLTRELAGAKKRPESVGALLGARRVLKKDQAYGYINVQFGEPIDARTFLARRDYDADADDAPDARHRAIRSLGYHTVAAAGAVTTVTPSSLCAAAMLSPGTLGVRRRLLLEAVQTLARAAAVTGARFSPGLYDAERGTVSEEAVERGLTMLGRDSALRLLGSGDDRVYVAEEHERIRLTYYTNQLLPHVVGPALAAIVLRTLAEANDPPFSLSTVRAATAFATSLVRLQFVHHAGRRFEDLAAEVQKQLLELRLIELSGEDNIRIARGQARAIDTLAGLVESSVESHQGTARALHMLVSGPMSRDRVEQEVLDQLHRWFLIGELRRFESCQQPLVQSAIDWLCEEGILAQVQRESDVALALARGHEDGRALEVLVHRTEQMLPSIGDDEADEQAA